MCINPPVYFLLKKITLIPPLLISVDYGRKTKQSTYVENVLKLIAAYIQVTWKQYHVLTEIIGIKNCEC